MSISDDIRNLTAKFHEEQTQKVLQGMDMESLSEVWHNMNQDLQTDQASGGNNDQKLNDYKERKEGVKAAITPEILQQKMDEYLVSLSSGSFTPADFSNILEFTNGYSMDGISDEMKNRLDNLKEKIADKRITLDKEINLDPSKIEAASIALESKDVEGINIEANAGIVSSLADKKLKNGKTITFKGKDGQDSAGVEFDASGHADILIPDKDGNATHYQMFNDGSFGLVDGDKTRIIEKENMSEQDLAAFNYAKDAEKVWEQFSDGKLDTAIEKEATVINEGPEEIKVNEGAENSTKINEGKNQKKDPLSTKINQGQEEGEGTEADVTGDTSKDKTEKEDEVYWKEGDIIDTMFKEWFLAAANSATNWVVHQIEYAASGVWDEFEKSYRQRKAEREKELKEAEKSPKTTKVYNDVYDIYDKNMKDAKDNTSKDKIAAQLKNGDINLLIGSNAYMQKLYKSSPQFLNEMLSPEKLKNPQYAENCAATLSGFITQAEAFSNKYAATSILDAQMKDKDAFKDKDIAKVYEEQKQIGMQILLRDMQRNKEANKDKNLADTMIESLKKMEEAEALAVKDYKNRNFNEALGTPHKNKILIELNTLIDPNAPQEPTQQLNPNAPVEPVQQPDPIVPDPVQQPDPIVPEPDPIVPKPDEERTLPEEATHEVVVDEQHNQQRDDANNEGASLDSRQAYIDRKRKTLEAYKSKGIQAPMQTKTVSKNIDLKSLRYDKTRG